MTLFTPFEMREVTLPNRVAISPMSQYRAKDGYANDWHLVHLGRFALGGAGLVFAEATAIEARGRRTPGDLGLWEDGQIDGLARVAAFLKAEGSVPGMQLGHAGRKASERRPWHGETPLTDEDAAERDEAPWATIGPSALPYGENWHVPVEMTRADIADVLSAFEAAAARADKAGFEVLEIYAAHGFLVHQFYSPVSNHRTDEYGGSLENRIRFPVEVAKAVRAGWPASKPLLFRISATDWLEDKGWQPDDTIVLARALKEAGVDGLDCSTGGIGGAVKPARMPLGQGFQVPFAEAVKKEVGLAAMAIGFLWDPDYAEAILAQGKADIVGFAREVLDDPNWARHAARTLGVDPNYADWPPEFGWWLSRRQRLIDKLELR